MTQRAANLAVATAFMAIGAGQIAMALRLPGGSLAEPGPNLFPVFVGALMSASATVYLVRELLHGSTGRLDVKEQLPKIAGISLTIALFALLLPRLGFVPTAFLLQLAMLRLFGLKRLVPGMALSAAMTLVAYFLFTPLLGVRFPNAQWLG